MTDIALTPAATSPRRQLWRLAAIILALGLPLGFATIAGLTLTSALESNEIADHADSTARSIVHQLDHKPAQADTTALYLASSNDSLARAELQALASHLIDAAGGKLIEARPAEDAAQETLGRVSLDVSLSITNAGLLDLLYAIETGLPLLTVPRLDVHSDGVADGQQANPELQVTLTIAGAWKAAGP